MRHLSAFSELLLSDTDPSWGMWKNGGIAAETMWKKYDMKLKGLTLYWFSHYLKSQLTIPGIAPDAEFQRSKDYIQGLRKVADGKKVSPTVKRIVTEWSSTMP